MNSRSHFGGFIGRAEGLLTHADHLAVDARRGVNHLESRFLLTYQASLHLMNAILIAGRSSSGALRGTHRARIEGCRALVPESASLFLRIDEARALRNRVTYDGDSLSESALDAAQRDLDELIIIASGYVQAARLLDESSSDSL